MWIFAVRASVSCGVRHAISHSQLNIGKMKSNTSGY